MQSIHYIVLALGAALAFSLLRIAVRAVAKDRRYQYAEGKAAGRIEGRSERLSEHNTLQLADLQTLYDISNTLQTAYKTWRLIPGTESYRLQAENQLKALHAMAIRIRNEGQDSDIRTVEQEKAA